MSEPRISALSFVYNEEVHIEESLKAIRPYVDEILIVDLESTDRTNEIACKYADKVFLKPHVICGDQYKMFLHAQSTGDWLLWFYPDEIWAERTMSSLKKIIAQSNITDKYTQFSFMRREYMDGVRLQYIDTIGNIVQHGTKEAPNYQNRLHRKCPEIFYTDLVHAEVHGGGIAYPMPPEYYLDHIKESKSQELDNVRLYVWYKYLIWLYGDTQLEPYKEHIANYRKIIRDSEAKNATKERRTHPGEEEWWRWRDFPLVPNKEVVDQAIKEQPEDKPEEEEL